LKTVRCVSHELSLNNEAVMLCWQVFPKFQDFTMVHDYLVTPNQKMQARIDRRGQNGRYPFTAYLPCGRNRQLVSM